MKLSRRKFLQASGAVCVAGAAIPATGERLVQSTVIHFDPPLAVPALAPGTNSLIPPDMVAREALAQLKANISLTERMERIRAR